MVDYQHNKSLILNFHNDLDKATGDDVTEVLKRYTSEDYFYRGVHPFYEQQGAVAVADVFWKPLTWALNPIQRRQDVFMAGTSEIDGGEWVCSMGHLMGLFDNDWLGIPATRKMTFLPYVEFNRIIDGKISETGFFCDIIKVMQQAGLNPLPSQTGAAILNPGPRTHDGLLFDKQDPAEGIKTMDLINRMIHDLVSAGLHSNQSELAETWHNDMIWFGPAGIGATFTIERYEAQHQGPFSDGLEDIQSKSHNCCFAEGSYGGLLGWDKLTMKPSGGFMGQSASNMRVEMPYVDIYRRDGDKLAENWIFLDLLYFLKQQGLDILERNRQLLAGR
jgi:hypothetical protein